MKNLLYFFKSFFPKSRKIKAKAFVNPYYTTVRIAQICDPLDKTIKNSRVTFEVKVMLLDPFRKFYSVNFSDFFLDNTQVIDYRIKIPIEYTNLSYKASCHDKHIDYILPVNMFKTNIRAILYPETIDVCNFMLCFPLLDERYYNRLQNIKENVIEFDNQLETNIQVYYINKDKDSTIQTQTIEPTNTFKLDKTIYKYLSYSVVNTNIFIYRQANSHNYIYYRFMEIYPENIKYKSGYNEIK